MELKWVCEKENVVSDKADFVPIVEPSAVMHRVKV